MLINPILRQNTLWLTMGVYMPNVKIWNALYCQSVVDRFFFLSNWSFSFLVRSLGSPQNIHMDWHMIFLDHHVYWCEINITLHQNAFSSWAILFFLLHHGHLPCPGSLLQSIFPTMVYLDDLLQLQFLVSMGQACLHLYPKNCYLLHRVAVFLGNVVELCV